MLKQNGYSAAVLFDLANADLRLGLTGEAILNYERAKWLAPRDPDISANLRYARKQAGLATPEDPWGENAAELLSPNGGAWLASASLVMLCAGLFGSQLLPNKGRGYLALLNTVSAMILIVAGGAMALRYQALDRAILTARTAPGLISPFAGAKTVCELSAGQMVQIERTHGGFDFVRDAGGRSGWVSRAQVALVVPEP